MLPIGNNLDVMRVRYPALAGRLEAFSGPGEVCVFAARDGGVAYGLRCNGRVVPLTDPDAPIARMREQLERNAAPLGNLEKPVLIVGLYPGEELLCVFDIAARQPEPHARQAIYVCVDSVPCLRAFLETYDASEVIASPRVRFFWHEDAPALVDELRAHPERPHTFTLISGSPNGTLDRVMPPFVALTRERKAETNRLQAENDAYYDGLGDNVLETMIRPDSRGTRNAVARNPRLLMPTCSWSTVTQYSARDTAAAFRALGWEVRHLNMEAQLTPYFMAKEINDFKPDVFLFINHLRTEALPAYPRNMMFITWIQDTIPHVHRKTTAEAWNKMAISPGKRDLLIGYTKQLEKYGYRKDRLVDMPMIVNPEVFKPRVLTEEQKSRYGCDICFASNISKTTDQIVRTVLVPEFAALQPEFIESGSGGSAPMNELLLMRIHDHLWTQYRAEKTFTTYLSLEEELQKLDGFPCAFGSLCEDDREHVIQSIYWKLNDAIYRQVVLEWLDEMVSETSLHSLSRPGSSLFRLYLYGNGWDRHPRFAKYHKGTLKHGEELSVAYQAANYCLHLNSMEGSHQRSSEILACGGRLLTRASAPPALSALASALRKIAATWIHPRAQAPASNQPPANSNATQGPLLTKSENDAFTEYLFNLASAPAIEVCPNSPKNPVQWERTVFRSKDQLTLLLRKS